MSEIMRIIDGRETQKITKRTRKQTNKQTNKDRKEQRETEAIAKGWELNDFAVHLSFLQLIHKASLIFKPNYCKTKRILWVKTCCAGV